ncbi:MAG: hypothetical protein J6S85_21925 [Methanobrevibacter sp.]|jgi:biotin operon repressor|nr:hypothetical protein [Methanobrevibacter sp.]MBQ1392873.1 hypothetical protein [Lachnospiraceae bacterium]
MTEILGIQMITQKEVGELIGTKSRSTISEWLARAEIDGTSIKGQKYYSVEQIRDYLRYGKTEIRKAVEILREISTLKRGKNE